jgi:transcriptional regulator with XRE-family HTH domain
MKFCEWLEAKRKELGLTQKKLACKSKVSVITIVRLEDPGYKPGDMMIGTIVRLARALGVSVREFTKRLGGIGWKSKSLGKRAAN